MEAFGSTKRKKAMKSRLQNKIDSEDLGHSVSGAVNHMISQPKRNGEEGTLYFKKNCFSQFGHRLKYEFGTLFCSIWDELAIILRVVHCILIICQGPEKG